MKTVILVRHAKSSWKDPGLEDFDRPLNKRGKRDAPFMGKKLRERRPRLFRLPEALRDRSNLARDPIMPSPLKFHFPEGYDPKRLIDELAHHYSIGKEAKGSAACLWLKTDRFEKVLAIVGRISNPLRDLDVYLQDESNHKAMLPAVLRGDIDPLFKYLRKERSRAFRDLVQHLLRLACKELRYLLEFFASLFPREKVDDVIQQLKKLQDLLGHFNDLRIPEKYLMAVAGPIPATPYRSSSDLP